MQYTELLTILKRFSFSEKMRIAQIHSQDTFTPAGIVEYNILRQIPSPWEIETFTLLSIKAREWKNDRFDSTNFRKFKQIMECIRNQNPKVLNTQNNQDLIEWILPLIGSVQFELQEFFPFKMYRYHYYFSYKSKNIDMPALFKAKFDCNYYTYCLLGYTLRHLFSKKAFTQKAFIDLIKMFNVQVKHLTISRQEYIDLLDGYARSLDDYLFCLRPSYTFPFISEEGIVYCPLPHLFSRATSSSLMHRLTDGNSNLRAMIGKEVFEEYLYTIIIENKLFDEVIAEQKYVQHRTEHKTVDIMARKGNCYVFLDCKSFSPKIAIRNADQKAFDQDVERLAEACVQVYKHIRQRFPLDYCFFETIPSMPIESIYGLVVIQDDPYFKSDVVHRKAAQILNIENDSNEYDWLCRHVGVVSIYHIERFCFTGTCFCDSLQRTSNESRVSNVWLNDYISSECSYDKYIAFADRLLKDTVALMIKLGIDIRVFSE